MLSKNKRLNLKKDFKWVASGEKGGDSLVQLFFRFGDNDNPRVGIALSKANFKKATERNRARRLVSFVFETFYNELPKGLNIIALPKSDVLGLTSEELAPKIRKVLEKSNLLKDEKNSN